ncbi:hypothetical protein RDWZM_008777 [Blomia tropicalis]|uniref:rRNA biogenesis protein RRP36 n=1 Tax=Blomia tropicalis TaxID=40697 RepID=A0A9Q0M1U3_BLOTA|nr:rRNA biogenesis protein rrp36 [Blomia tropicalis]KAJ6217620.1 hypothetical protein RDWZM_008777 [Blomia tropicalis]
MSDIGENYYEYEDQQSDDESIKQEDIDADNCSDSLHDDLAQTTFEELLCMKDKLGTKIYRDTVLSKFSNKDKVDDNNEELKQIKSRPSKPKVKGNPNLSQFKRVNRSYPIEATSKRVDYRYNFASLPATTATNLANKSQQKTFRDPRFENNKNNDFKLTKFEQNYSFLNEKRSQELQSLQMKLKKTKSEDEKEKIIKSIQIIKNQLQTHSQKEQSKVLKNKIKEKVAEIKFADSSLQVDNHKLKPKINKSTMKRAQLAEKFKQLKQSGKLEKYLEKKRKKNALKDRRLFSS